MAEVLLTTTGLKVNDESPPAPREPPAAPRFVVGLDLGKLQDFTALCLLEWEVPGRRPLGWRPQYACTLLRRWPLQTPYLDIIGQVAKFLTHPPLSQALPVLVVDSTGVGEAVTELCRSELGKAVKGGGLVGVTITAGSAVTYHGPGRWHVAKKQLVSVLQVVLGQGRLKVAPDLPECATLLRELGTFTVKVTESANESFESWREKDKDDLVLAVALACWAAERLLSPAVSPPPGPRFVRT
jgi:hypothetical protein